jgi:asparaginyl-tRNA synthetase
MIVSIAECGKHVGQDVTIQGWMYNRRSGKGIHFLQLRDGTGMMQGVAVQAELPADTWDLASKLTMESSVRVTGTVRAHPKDPAQFEMTVKGLEAIQIAEEYPISKKEHGPDFLLDHRHLWLRSSKQWALMRVRNVVIKACRDFFDDRGFILIDAPVFTPNACEGTTNLFEVEYFDQKAYLTQSGQLYMEAAAMAHGKVYCFGPAFRAEKSKTRRHLTEFWMIEPEVAFLDWNGNMDLQEELVCYVVQRVLERCKSELKVLGRDIAKLEAVKAPFPRISYTEAIDILKGKGHPIEWGGDFGAEDETVLSNQFDRPVMVYKYPAAVKAFYMKPDPEDPRVALGNDMLAPEGYGEIVGAGQRMDDLEQLRAAIKAHNLPEEFFGWFLDLRKYGTVPHSGFGMGIERCVAWICGLEHVRETIPFPRTIYRLTP